MTKFVRKNIEQRYGFLNSFIQANFMCINKIYWRGTNHGEGIFKNQECTKLKINMMFLLFRYTLILNANTQK